MKNSDHHNIAASVAKLLGHSLAVAIGFVGLAAISAIPMLALKALMWMGMEHLADSMHELETLLLTVDTAVFAVVFLAGVTVFLVEIVSETKREIRRIWSKDE